MAPAQLHRKQHMPAAIHSDLFAFGPKDLPLTEFEERLRSWGVGAGQQVVVYDEGGTDMATRLFWDQVHHGSSAESLLILNGGMSRWFSVGSEVTQAATPKPSPGTVRITEFDHGVRVRLPKFLVATGDPRNNVMLQALEPSYFHSGVGFFNRECLSGL